jgi:hypothetical protein
MPSQTGRVSKITVSESLDAACVNLLDSSLANHLFMLWSYPTSDTSAEARIVHGMFLSIARDALANGKDVTVTHDSGSSLVTAIDIAN